VVGGPLQPRPSGHQFIDTPESSAQPVIYVYHVPRQMRMHSVDDDTLDTLASGYNATSLALLGITIGVFVTAVATLLTADFASPYTFAGFVAAAIVSLLLTIYFGLCARTESNQAKKRVQRIRGGGVIRSDAEAA
jgi:VIT1/CCC1 family predicted Fe2+/Mn2+ transporter